MSALPDAASPHSPIGYEEMSLNAWPSLKTCVFKGCLLRSSNGYTNRANSANPLYTDPADFGALVDYAEGFYASERLPPVFKILGIPRHESLDAALVSRGYEKVTETAVMTVGLGDSGVAASRVGIGDVFDADWITACASFNGYPEAKRETLTRMLALIGVDTIVASLPVDGGIVACGYGAVERGVVGFFDIIVDPARRGRGYGREIMVAIMDEARRRGARAGYLQVVATNAVAIRLYESLGFKPAYSYWYRRLNPP